MSDIVRIKRKELLAKSWGSFTNYVIEQKRRDGGWQELEREVYDHGLAAAILLCDPKAGTVILTRQFRFPVHLNGDNPMMIEVCAGMLDGEAPQKAAIREAEEESGYRVSELAHAFDIYMSPGSITEKIWCFTALYDADSKIGLGGGLEHEGEDIEVLEMPFEAAFGMIGNGEITDGKTILLLQHAKLAGIFEGA